MFTLNFIRIIIWGILFDTASAAGRLESPFLLIVSIVFMTYWYWKDPIFKDKDPNRRTE